MRTVLMLLVLLATAAWAQPAPDDKTETDRAAETLLLAKKAAESYTVSEERPTGRVTLKLHPEPLLQWSNPVGGSFHGSVFVWTDGGRPEVIASVYRKYVPLPRHLGVEFHSLTGATVSAEGSGNPEWLPAAGIDPPAPVPDASAPAESAAARLRQLRAMAREFTASKTDRKDVTRPLRLLTQPIDRYESPDRGIIDGALFAFVEGTDPEVFMLMEASHGEREKAAAWRYSLVRMNSVNFRVSHKGREVWSVPTIPWQQAFNPREPYTLFIFRPGQGVNPPDEPANP